MKAVPKFLHGSCLFGKAERSSSQGGLEDLRSQLKETEAKLDQLQEECKRDEEALRSLLKRHSAELSSAKFRAEECQQTSQTLLADKAKLQEDLISNLKVLRERDARLGLLRRDLADSEFELDQLRIALRCTTDYSVLLEADKRDAERVLARVVAHLDQMTSAAAALVHDAELAAAAVGPAAAPLPHHDHHPVCGACGGAAAPAVTAALGSVGSSSGKGDGNIGDGRGVTDTHDKQQQPQPPRAAGISYGSTAPTPIPTDNRSSSIHFPVAAGPGLGDPNGSGRCNNHHNHKQYNCCSQPEEIPSGRWTRPDGAAVMGGGCGDCDGATGHHNGECDDDDAPTSKTATASPSSSYDPAGPSGLVGSASPFTTTTSLPAYQPMQTALAAVRRLQTAATGLPAQLAALRGQVEALLPYGVAAHHQIGAEEEDGGAMPMGPAGGGLPSAVEPAGAGAADVMDVRQGGQPAPMCLSSYVLERKGALPPSAGIAAAFSQSSTTPSSVVQALLQLVSGRACRTGGEAAAQYDAGTGVLQDWAYRRYPYTSHKPMRPALGGLTAAPQTAGADRAKGGDDGRRTASTVSYVRRDMGAMSLSPCGSSSRASTALLLPSTPPPTALCSALQGLTARAGGEVVRHAVVVQGRPMEGSASPSRCLPQSARSAAPLGGAPSTGPVLSWGSSPHVSPGSSSDAMRWGSLPSQPQPQPLQAPKQGAVGVSVLGAAGPGAAHSAARWCTNTFCAPWHADSADLSTLAERAADQRNHCPPLTSAPAAATAATADMPLASSPPSCVMTSSSSSPGSTCQGSNAAIAPTAGASGHGCPPPPPSASTASTTTTTVPASPSPSFLPVLGSTLPPTLPSGPQQATGPTSTAPSTVSSITPSTTPSTALSITPSTATPTAPARSTAPPPTPTELELSAFRRSHATLQRQVVELQRQNDLLQLQLLGSSSGGGQEAQHLGALPPPPPASRVTTPQRQTSQLPFPAPSQPHHPRYPSWESHPCSNTLTHPHPHPHPPTEVQAWARAGLNICAPAHMRSRYCVMEVSDRVPWFPRATASGTAAALHPSVGYEGRTCMQRPPPPNPHPPARTVAAAAAANPSSHPLTAPYYYGNLPPGQQQLPDPLPSVAVAPGLSFPRSPSGAGNNPGVIRVGPSRALAAERAGVGAESGEERVGGGGDWVSLLQGGLTSSAPGIQSCAQQGRIGYGELRRHLVNTQESAAAAAAVEAAGAGSRTCSGWQCGAAAGSGRVSGPGKGHTRDTSDRITYRSRGGGGMLEELADADGTCGRTLVGGADHPQLQCCCDGDQQRPEQQPPAVETHHQEGRDSQHADRPTQPSTETASPPAPAAHAHAHALAASPTSAPTAVRDLGLESVPAAALAGPAGVHPALWELELLVACNKS